MVKGNNKEKNKQNVNVGTKRTDNSEHQEKVTNSKKY